MDQSIVSNQHTQQNQQNSQSRRSNRGNWETRRASENANIKDKYKIGQEVEGKIILFFKAGKEHPDKSALVRLSQGGTALLLYNEILGYPRHKVDELYAIGETVNTAVTAIRPSKNRLSVSFRPVMRKRFVSCLEIGSIVEATIIDRVKYGYFVDLGGGLEALLHCDNLDQNFHNQRETFDIGDKTEVAVLSIENDGARIGVGRKQLFS